MIPIVREHDGVLVVRDDLFPGGTKARFCAELFELADELVYATPAEGGAQTALAECARAAGKRLTLFVARRADPHPRTLMARRLGATIHEVSPGYLSVVSARAAAYAAEHDAYLVPFGIDTPGALAAIARAAASIDISPDEVWCAAGSGVLARGLAHAWPRARRCVVQVGRELSNLDVAGAEIDVHELPFGTACREAPPFPSDPFYDAKAWQKCLGRRGAGRVLFWNVTGPPN